MQIVGKTIAFFFTSKTEEALQFFCPNNGEKLLLLQAGSCMTILCLLHVDIPVVSIVVPKVKQLAQCRLDMASVCTAYIHCHTPPRSVKTERVLGVSVGRRRDGIGSICLRHWYSVGKLRGVVDSEPSQ